MSFDGDLYPTAGAKAVMTTTGDLVRYNAGTRQRLGIGSTNQALSVVGGLPAWKTLTLADSVLTTAGDVLYENNTPELARLPKGTDGDVLTLASGLPSWSAVGGGGAWELIGNAELTADAATLPLTWSALSFDDYSCVSVFFHIYSTAANDPVIKLQNPVLTGNYVSNRFYVDAGTSGSDEETRAGSFRLPRGDLRNMQGRIDIFAMDSDFTANDQNLMYNLHAACTPSAMCIQSGYYSGATDITESTGIEFSWSGGNLYDGSYCTAIKQSRT